MAIKFHLPDGSETDMDAIRFFRFQRPDFRHMLLAVAASPPNAAKPTKLDQFVAAHPAVPRALAMAQTPDSFADEGDYGINAFVNNEGERRAVRYIPPRWCTWTQRKRPRRRVFRLKVQLASPGDTTKDPSQPWPDRNEVVELGVLTIDTTCSRQPRCAKDAATHRRSKIPPAQFTAPQKKVCPAAVSGIKIARYVQEDDKAASEDPFEREKPVRGQIPGLRKPEISDRRIKKSTRFA
jgi:hypothetical protein